MYKRVRLWSQLSSIDVEVWLCSMIGSFLAEEILRCSWYKKYKRVGRNFAICSLKLSVDAPGRGNIEGLLLTINHEKLCQLS
jgi:hypothetical protein